MSEALQDEVISINAIYGPDTLIASADKPSSIFILSLPSRPDISLRVEFPKDYPDAPPVILGTQSVGRSDGIGPALVDAFCDTLSEVYEPGIPCVFDVLEDAMGRIQALLGEPGTSKDALSPGPEEMDGQAPGAGTEDSTPADQSQQLNAAGESNAGTGNESSLDTMAPPWFISEVVTEKKSVFVARAAAVTSVQQARSFVAHLLSTDKKVAKATHNITAWRLRGNADVGGAQFKDCDDDGESAAGGRLLHLLELMGACDLVVVVSRWYGGVHLGPDRFRLINQSARDAISKGNFTASAQTETGDGGKKKGKK
jgi:hypothetical protein